MYAILVDASKCTGCEKCVDACIETNGLNEKKAEIDKAVTKDGLSDNRFLSVNEIKKDSFARKSCMHCVEPSCVSACLVGGLTKSKEGPVLYDPDKCIGCRYCMLSCPFYIPRYEWSKTQPFVKKCDMCYDRIKEGKLPACVDACPYGVLEFGEREELLKKAKRKIQQDPKYVNRVWGEKELGGTSVLFISDFDVSQVGFPQQASVAIPELTEPLIEKTPQIGLGVLGGLLGLNWIIRRREKLSKENQENSKNKNEE